jgi:hypothetical protein
MRLDTDLRSAGIAPAEASAKPPPVVSERMFLTMDEFRKRHGTARSPKDRIIHAGRAAFASLLLLAALCGMLLLLQ